MRLEVSMKIVLAIGWDSRHLNKHILPDKRLVVGQLLGFVVEDRQIQMPCDNLEDGKRESESYDAGKITLQVCYCNYLYQRLDSPTRS